MRLSRLLIRTKDFEATTESGPMKTSPSPLTTQLQLWSDDGSKRRLLAARHRTTGDVQFPPFRSVSPVAADYDTIALSEHGVLYSYSMIHANPKSGIAPFAIGYVDFPEGARVFGRVVTQGQQRPRIGSALRAIHDAEHGYVFEPASSKDPQ
jgi:uncharacterized OB-fold protein